MSDLLGVEAQDVHRPPFRVVRNRSGFFEKHCARHSGQMLAELHSRVLRPRGLFLRRHVVQLKRPHGEQADQQIRQEPVPKPEPASLVGEQPHHPQEEHREQRKEKPPEKTLDMNDPKQIDTEDQTTRKDWRDLKSAFFQDLRSKPDHGHEQHQIGKEDIGEECLRVEQARVSGKAGRR